MLKFPDICARRVASRENLFGGEGQGRRIARLLRTQKVSAVIMLPTSKIFIREGK